MTILRVGTNDKYSSGWESIFGDSKPAKKDGAAKKSQPAKKAVSSKKTAIAAVEDQAKAAKKTAKKTLKKAAKASKKR